MAKIEIFPPAWDTLVLPGGSKILSKSLYLLQFSRYSHFFKNPRWPPKVAKIEIFPLCIGYSCTTLWVKKFARNHSISYSLRYSHFFIFRKNPRWPPKVAKIEIFPLGIGYSCTSLRVKNICSKLLYLLRFARYL